MCQEDHRNAAAGHVDQMGQSHLLQDYLVLITRFLIQTIQAIKRKTDKNTDLVDKCQS